MNLFIIFFILAAILYVLTLPFVGQRAKKAHRRRNWGGKDMRIYVNKKKQLILAPEVWEKYGGVSNETIQIKNGEFAKEIEKEVNEAMQEIIERWQPFIENVPVDELFSEKQKQLRTFSDYETTLTDLLEQKFNEM